PHALLGKSGKTGWTAVILLHKSAHLNCTPGQSVLWGPSQTGNPASAGHAPREGVPLGKRMSATTGGARPGRGRRTAPPKPARHRPAMEIDGKGIVRSARRTLRSNSYKIYFQTIPPSPQNARECDLAHKLLAECGQSRARRPSGGLVSRLGEAGFARLRLPRRAGVRGGARVLAGQGEGRRGARAAPRPAADPAAVGPDGAVRGRPGTGGPRGPVAAAAARGDRAAAGKRRRGPGRAAALAADGTGPRPALHDHARPDGHGRTGELTATL